MPAPANWIKTKLGTELSEMELAASEKALPKVTAGFAKELDDVKK